MSDKPTTSKHELINKELVIKAVSDKAERDLDKFDSIIHLDGYQLVGWVAQAIKEFNEGAR